MLSALLLAELQNIGQQEGTEQGAEAFSEDDGRGKDADDDQQHDKINGGHQYGAEQKTDADEQRVFEHGAGGIVESCKERKDIHQDNGVGDGGNAENCRAERPEQIFKPHMIQHVSVHAENDSGSKQDQPYEGALSKILSERAEKRLCNIALFIFGNLQRHVEKRGGGCADGDHRNTAEEL